jgi:cytochrome c-type biogenesis protein CcmH
MRSTRLGLATTLVLAAAPFGLVRAQSAEPAFELPQARPEQVVGAPRGQKLTGDALERRTEDVGALLRCPVCQGLSVADSRAGTAVAMKSQVRDMLAAGYDQEQVLNYFERSYGGFVRLEPKWDRYWLVWLAPLAGLLLGGVIVVRALRVPRSPATARPDAPPAAPDPAADGGDDLPGRDTLPDDADLARYVRRVRELAYGWPDGEPPRAA